MSLPARDLRCCCPKAGSCWKCLLLLRLLLPGRMCTETSSICCLPPPQPFAETSCIDQASCNSPLAAGTASQTSLLLLLLLQYMIKFATCSIPGGGHAIQVDPKCAVPADCCCCLLLLLLPLHLPGPSPFDTLHLPLLQACKVSSLPACATAAQGQCLLLLAALLPPAELHSDTKRTSASRTATNNKDTTPHIPTVAAANQQTINAQHSRASFSGPAMSLQSCPQISASVHR
jgi:hypothetical protein